jgi:hypothetical protein
MNDNDPKYINCNKVFFPICIHILIQKFVISISQVSQYELSTYIFNDSISKIIQMEELMKYFSQKEKKKRRVKSFFKKNIINYLVSYFTQLDYVFFLV